MSCTLENLKLEVLPRNMNPPGHVDREICWESSLALTPLYIRGIPSSQSMTLLTCEKEKTLILLVPGDFDSYVSRFACEHFGKWTACVELAPHYFITDLIQHGTNNSQKWCSFQMHWICGTWAATKGEPFATILNAKDTDFWLSAATADATLCNKLNEDPLPRELPDSWHWRSI